MSQDFTRHFSDAPGGTKTRTSIWQFLRIDPPLLLALMLLSIFGLMVLYSASGENVEEVQRQAMAIAVAFVVMFIVAQFNVHFFRRWAPSLYTAGIGLLALVLLMGVEKNGARSWLDLPGLPSFQPSEIMKFVVPMLLAWYLGSRQLPPGFKHLFCVSGMEHRCHRLDGFGRNPWTGYFFCGKRHPCQPVLGGVYRGGCSLSTRGFYCTRFR